MKAIKIYYNGIKVEGSNELVKLYINITNGDKTVSIYARDYQSIPRGYGFNVTNDTDSQTDYFESDHGNISEDHPFFKFFYYAALKERNQGNKRILKSRYYDEKRKEEARQAIQQFEMIKEPGQPTKKDLEHLENWLQQKAAEVKAKKEAQERQEQEEREAQVFIEKIETEITINTWETKYPIVPGQAFVEIPFSERIGIENGSKWSLKAAQHIFEDLDRREHAMNRGYDKTDFIIRWTESDGEKNTYEGRYDIGDGENGLLQHIFNFAEWHRVHDEFGHPVENPPQITPNIKIFNRIVELYNT